MTFFDAPRRSPVRRCLFQVHLWLGLVLGPVIATVTLTGSIVVFRYELNRVTTPGTAYVEPQGQRLTLDRLAAIVQAARPEDRLRSVGWGEAGPAVAWNFRAESPEGHRIHTFVDPYTGEITGRDDYHDKWLQWFYDLHATLLAGEAGRLANGFVGLATAVLGISGLVVWWPGTTRWRSGFRYRFGTGWKRQNYDLHKIAGFYSSLILVVVSLSGAYFAFPAAYHRIAEALTGRPVVVGPPRAETEWRERTVPMEHFIRVAERLHDGAAAISVRFPQADAEPVTVRTKEPKDWHRIGLNYVYLEPADARLIRSDRFGEGNAATQAALFMYPLHFGRFGGRWGRVPFYGVMVGYMIVGLAPVILAATGWLMYRNRSLSKRRQRK